MAPSLFWSRVCRCIFHCRTDIFLAFLACSFVVCGVYQVLGSLFGVDPQVILQNLGLKRLVIDFMEWFILFLAGWGVSGSGVVGLPWLYCLRNGVY